jgi:hypothetical protein
VGTRRSRNLERSRKGGAFRKPVDVVLPEWLRDHVVALTGQTLAKRLRLSFDPVVYALVAAAAMTAGCSMSVLLLRMLLDFSQARREILGLPDDAPGSVDMQAAAFVGDWALADMEAVLLDIAGNKAKSAEFIAVCERWKNEQTLH